MRPATKIVVFLGPSLPVAEARAVLDATYLPPAAQADFISAVTTYHPEVIGLIDGMFLQHLSVWHKEILYALERGIRVYGASSIGALRAAETAAFGMVGVGEVYRMYAGRELVDDDEVALAHGHAADGFRKLSEPMVNIRATFRAAQAAGLLDEAQLGTLLGLAKAIYFPERTFPLIFREAAAAGVPAAVIGAMEAFVRTSYVDIKRADAIRLLETLRDLPRDEPASRPAFSFATTRLYEALHERDRTVLHDGMAVPLVSVAHYAALHLEDWDELNFHALNRALVGVLAEIIGFEPPLEAVESECRRFRRGRQLEDDAALGEWLAQHHLHREEWLALMREMATCRALQRSLLVGYTIKGSARLILDELRLRGDYPQLLAQAATQRRIAEAHRVAGEAGADAELPLGQLLAEHLQETACRIDVDPAVWCEEAGFERPEELRQELLEARLVRGIIQRITARLATLTGEGTETAAGEERAGSEPGPKQGQHD